MNKQPHYRYYPKVSHVVSVLLFLGGLIFGLIRFDLVRAQGGSAFDLTTSTLDSAGNSHLGDNHINDVYFYDTTKDSDGGAWRQGGLGKFGSDALSFDGMNDYADMGSDSSLDIGVEMTIEAWIKADSFPSFSTVLTRNFGGGAQYGFRFDDNTLTGGMANTQKGFWVAGISSFNTNEWYHIALVFNALANSYAIYKNGEVISSGMLTAESKASMTGNLNIGRDNRNQDYFDGLIDEVRIYNRALTEAEVQANMNSVTPNTNGLVGS